MPRESKGGFAWRGGQVRNPRGTVPASPIWNEEHRSGKRRYRINREHPLIAGLLNGDAETRKLARSAISLIERSVPVERIWLDISENVEAAPGSEAADAILVDDLVTAVISSSNPGSEADVLDALLRSMRLDAPPLRKAVMDKLGKAR